MPIIPSTTVGHRGGDAVVPFVVGWTAVSGVLGDALGELKADQFVRAVLEGKISARAIIAEIRTNATLRAQFGVRHEAILAKFFTEAAIMAGISTTAVVEASPTTRALLNAFIYMGGEAAQIGLLELTARVTVSSSLRAHVCANAPLVAVIRGAC